jgi:predicted N-formylglutamate amidohydrolase
VDLGVGPEALRGQASWDHGAYDIARHLGEGLGLAVHAGLFSRMWVDLNRSPDHPDVVPIVSYGEPVPGNAHLTPAARAERVAAFHAPYWRAVAHEVEARLRDRGAVLHLSSHSFDPALDPAARTYEVGVLYDPAHAFEAELAERMLFQLRSSGLDVRANQPYGGLGPALTTSLRRTHAGARYAGIQLETSYLVTRRPGGCARVAAALAPLLEALTAGA